MTQQLIYREFLEDVQETARKFPTSTAVITFQEHRQVLLYR